MAKRKITVTVDEDLVESIQALGSASLSAVVNEALATEVERRARAAALGRMLADWDGAFGPVSGEAATAAADAFDDVDAVAAAPEPRPVRRRRRGVA
jgi:predicted transcriptional regulator